MSTVRLGFGDVGACVCVMKVKTRFSLIYITSEPRILHLHSFHAHKPRSPQAYVSVRAQFKPEKANSEADRPDRLSMGLERLKGLGPVRRTYRYGAIFKSAVRPRSLIHIAHGSFARHRRSLNHG